MKRLLATILIALAALMPARAQRNSLRAPAYPIITIDPNISAWSAADRLYDEDLRHWSLKHFPLRGYLTVDGTQYRFMGGGDGTTATQLYADVQATQTHYAFSCGPVELQLTFMAPLLMNDLELISRPVNYISYKIIPSDKTPHSICMRFEASPLWGVNTPDQETVQARSESGRLVLLSTGTKSQDILGRKGDDVRIDWGYFYLAAEKKGTDARIGEGGMLIMERDFGTTRMESGKIMAGYDDIYSVRYFGDKLRPYWNRSGDKTAQTPLQRL